MAVPVDLEHRRAQSEHEESGSLTFYETRGVRDSSVSFLFSEFEATLSLGNHTGHVDAETYGSLFEAANYWLREIGEKDFLGVVGDADTAKKSARTRKQQNRIDRLTFQRWRFEIGMKHGFLSPAAIAANFLTASDLVHRLVKGNEQLQRAIYQFADAWHWMHFEGKGEHELAAIGLKSIQGRAKGPAAKQQRGKLKKEIVKNIYESFASDENNGPARRNAKQAGHALLGDVNQKLRELGIQEMAPKSLTDELRPLVKKHFPKRK